MKKFLILVLLNSAANLYADAQNAGMVTNAVAGTNATPAQAHWTPTDIMSVSAEIALGVVILAIMIGIFVLGSSLFSFWREQLKSISPQAQQSTDGQFRSLLAQAVTVGALIFIAFVSGITLLSAGLYSLLPHDDGEAKKFFFEVVKYLLATVLPVISAWVGTVIAFYFGKENFEAATKSVKDMAAALTSKDKLAATSVSALGKAKQDCVFYPIDTTDPKTASATVHLDAIENAFKNYERLPVLFKNEAPYFLLHQSTLNDFLLTQIRDTPPKTAAQCTLADLFAKGKDGNQWLPENSFATVGPNATAAQAKLEMEKKPGCSDVLVTMDGTPATAVLRWITNVDLLKASEV